MLCMSEELKTERVALLMTRSEVRAIEDWSFQSRIRSRGEAIRRLVQIGLRAAAEASIPAAVAMPDVSGAAHTAAAETDIADASAAETGSAEWPIGRRQSKPRESKKPGKDMP